MTKFITAVDDYSVRGRVVSDDDGEVEVSNTRDVKYLEDEVETGSCTSEHPDAADETQEEDQKLNLVKKETVAVFRLRLLVFLVLLLAAVTVSIIIFLVTATAESDEYHSQYDSAAKKVLETFIDIVNTKLGAVSAMGVAIIAHGVDHEKSWPFVTLSSFQQRASTARKQSGALYVHINPMVEDIEKGAWEEFVVSEDADWVQQGLDYQKDVGLLGFEPEMDGYENLHLFNGSDTWPIWRRDYMRRVVPEDAGTGPFMPTWQTSPVFHEGRDVNENLLQSSSRQGLNDSFYSESVVIGQFITSEPGDVHSSNPLTAWLSLMLSAAQNEPVEYAGDPFSQIFFPIFDSFRDNRKSVAVMGAWIHWMSYFQYLLPASLDGIYVVLHDSCSHSFTYEINGEAVRPVGRGDLHDTRFNKMKRSASFDAVQNIGDGTKHGLPLNKELCMISIDVYPSNVFYKTYNTPAPIIMTVAVSMIFMFTACMFVFYNRLVEWRQALVMHKAAQTNRIVSGLFPENVRERLMKQTPGMTVMREGCLDMSQSRRLSGFLGGVEELEMAEAPPIADLFPHCTVLFADIAGFTAWSSTRDPEKVFILLQTVYQSFDKIAKRRKVFKVETIGDSYLAVCGLPEPQPQHALIMCRFAWDCMQRMEIVTRELECTLGPDTGDLSMRFGLHSGPVTAGVLRGDRARFQLFGDTVNTASRMESNGQRRMIQISQETATLVMKAGKDHWLTPRKDKIMAKGKGMLQTYYVDPTKKRGNSLDSGDTSKMDHIGQTDSFPDIEPVPQSVNYRLINWMVDLLVEDVKKIVNVRRKCGMKEKNSRSVSYFPPKGQTGIQEVLTVIEMPKFESKKAAVSAAGDYSKVAPSPEVLSGLNEYVTTISRLYRDQNPFHNFEHACHVTMSAKKLLKRIVTPELPSDTKLHKKNKTLALLHDYTHGMNSDPLLGLAITFSALIHDVDHRGVSNAQLASEDMALGQKYSNQSVAEQNSLDIAWEVLMEDRFDALRRHLFATEAELLRFRQLIVNVVLATDIFDKELNDLRRNRWERAFCSGNERSSTNSLSSTSGRNQNDAESDLRATIVIEHIIQASDVSHTMQHWHVYQKWNKNLFMEMSRAYREGRMSKDPSGFWYKGEIGFFDNYVIPLTKKLKECGVFGVSSDEYLNYALQNRQEWEHRGEEIVSNWTEELSKTEDEMTDDSITFA
ncbi:Receptor-type guanylate cyclase gcy [Seminavis robusta]|uniref:Receptor-type guanylate cyclase gcy n=1 Tax=Seminavis robusta TaxID=568900 RepID=A0A9N8EFI3_9STRA|nr:Receptor-type guanylate cyclase gcy [Seminavis robusta]|eukprot:Sro869_g213470.1 Receptor-type guanylate cyclase gcy (1199) ;mRNA; f:19945-24929